MKYIKGKPVTEPGLLTEYITQSQGDKARARDIINDFFYYYEQRTGEVIKNDLKGVVVIDNPFLRRIEILMPRR